MAWLVDFGGYSMRNAPSIRVGSSVSCAQSKAVWLKWSKPILSRRLSPCQLPSACRATACSQACMLETSRAGGMCRFPCTLWVFCRAITPSGWVWHCVTTRQPSSASPGRQWPAILALSAGQRTHCYMFTLDVADCLQAHHEMQAVVQPLIHCAMYRVALCLVILRCAACRQSCPFWTT